MQVLGLAWPLDHSLAGGNIVIVGRYSVECKDSGKVIVAISSPVDTDGARGRRALASQSHAHTFQF